MTLDAVGIAGALSAGLWSFLSPCLLPRFASTTCSPLLVVSRL